MVTTVTNNSPQAINTSLFSLQKEIDDLRRQINQMKTKDTAELAKGLVSDDTPDMSVDENSIKNIMKPNYTTGRLPAGIYNSGQTVSVSASITTTRGNPVFISYSGDFNSIGDGYTVPWISFNLYADDVLIQRTVVDNSSAYYTDNTSFAGNALAVLSAGSHTIRLDAVLNGGSTGQIQFQEQENIINLVAFEL